MHDFGALAFTNSMNLSGLTDSLAMLAAPPNECLRCHTISRIAHGLCLVCLLQTGEDEKEEMGGDEFGAALDAVAVSDTHWRLGNYEILEEIGRGGMGVIYRARQRHSRRIVALKRVLSYHADSHETLARFRREAEAAASLDHPNILPIYEVGESEDGVPFFSMKYASGGSLQEVGPALRNDPREIVRLMAKIARSVQYAHRQSILHRDLKPGNILLDGRSEPLVSDFGLAKWLDASSDLTRSLTIFGTPGYIAPEQAKGPAANLKPAADVYSLGAILFDLLTGRPPFLGEHALAVIQQAADKPAPKLRSLVRHTNRDLETICARCLEREPAARYSSAGELAEDLDRWLEGRPIVARPVSPPVQAWRWARRNPFLASAAAVAVLLGGVLIVAQLERTRLVRTVQVATIYRRSIAVVPFLDLDTAMNNSQIAKSFAAAAQTKLSQLAPARVIPIADHSWPGAGTVDTVRRLTNEAGTRTMLIGTVRRVDQKFSVSIHLVDGSSGETLLQRRILLNDLNRSSLRLSDPIAAELSSVLDGHSQPQSKRQDPALQNPTANEYIRAGQEFDHRRSALDHERALQCFENAIKAEPSSALARSYYVLTAVASSYLDNSGVLLARSEQMAREAERLRPDMPESHRAIAALLYTKGNLRESLEQMFQAIELAGLSEDPAVAVAQIFKDLCRPDLSLRWHEVARQIQEHPADYEFTLGDCWTDLGQDEKAGAAYQRVSALHPDFPEGWMGLCRLRLLQGDFAAARKIYRENIGRYRGYGVVDKLAAQVEFFARNFPEAQRLYTALAESDPDGGGALFGCVSHQSALGRLRCLTGDDSGGRKILSDALRRESAALAIAPDHPQILYRVAALESSLGQKQQALHHLALAVDAGWLDYRSFQLDPRFDAIRDDPECTKITQAMASNVTRLRELQSSNITN
jgi:tetratricopeptide (TPR) repeat protein/tRNA A-37 threonylcarbamoyl transferase component Bud32